MKNYVQVLTDGNEVSRSYKDERMIYSEATASQRKAFFNRYFFVIEKVVNHLCIYQLHNNRDSDLRIIDAACGDGAGSAFLAEQLPDCEIMGVDRDETTIRRAVEKYCPMFPNLKFEAKDVLDIGQRADVFVSFETIEHLENKKMHEFLEKIADELLYPVGKFVVSTPRCRPRESLKRRESHINELYYQQFKYDLGMYFPMTEFFSFDRYANIVPDNPEAIIMVAICSKWPETNIL